MPRKRNLEPKFQVDWREEVAANLRGLGLVARSSPGFVLGMLATTVVQGILPAILVAQTGVFLANLPGAIQGGLSSPAGAQAQRALVLIGGAILASQVLSPVQEAARFGLQRRFHSYLTRRLMAAVASLPGLAYFEDPKFRDKLKVSEWVGWAPVNSINALSGAIQQTSSVIGFAAVAAAFAGWVPALLIGAAVPAGLASIYFEAGIGMARWRHSDEMRRSDYYRGLALLVEPAKELRMFRLKDWVVNRQVTHWLAGVKEAWETRRRSILIRIGLLVPSIAAMSVAFLAVLNAATSGRIDAGRFSATALATTGLVTAVVSVFQSLSWARQANFYLPVAFQIMGFASNDPRLDVTGTREARSVAPSGIQFENVAFSYPGTERKVLDALDLWIPSGSSLALVGENGAGKTTLIKLLCRLYDPTEGRILIDGVDVREFDLDSLRNRMAVIFQDFVKYHLPVRDNVGFGAVDRLEDESLLVEAATRVRVLGTIEELPQGWDTILAREFDGVDLSGGEWQRVALARAMTAQIGRDADILILDEPTASLDVRLEHELYEHFSELSSGRTTLLVSHRFTTVRMAGRIVFMENGRIVEDGSHESLMAARGRYSELYEMQASHYRLTGSLE